MNRSCEISFPITLGDRLMIQISYLTSYDDRMGSAAVALRQGGRKQGALLAKLHSKLMKDDVSVPAEEIITLSSDQLGGDRSAPTALVFSLRAGQKFKLLGVTTC